MQMTIEEFLDTVKVLRMLYGTQIAKAFFEKNMQTFTGYLPKDLHNLGAPDTITVTPEINT